MINARRTGAYISQLRKAKDWTQAELAERLHVTHQAVSQWEKGASFPDVGLLPQVARLLDTSVDALLNGEPVAGARRVTRGALVEELARGNTGEVARLVQEDPEGLDLMLDTAPLTRPSQLNAVVGQLSGLSFTLEQAVSLAPFVAPEVLQDLLERAQVEAVDAETLTSLAPFLDEPMLDRLAQRLPAGALTAQVVGQLAPHMGGQALMVQVRRLMEAGHAFTPDEMEGLAPFVDDDSLATLLERMPAGPVSIDFVTALAPYAGEDAVDRLLARLDDPAAFGRHLEQLAPFLSQASLERGVRQAQDRLSADTLVALAPFLDRETLASLLRQNNRA